MPSDPMTAMSTRMRILLADHFTREELHDLVRDHDWDLINVIDADTAANIPFELIYRDWEETFSLHYFEDHLVDLRYIVLTGPAVADIAELIRGRLSTVDLAAAIQTFENSDTSAEAAHGIYRVAIAAGPTRDSQVLTAFADALRHESEGVRNAAIFGMGYVEWSELIPLLREVDTDDPNDEVRANARIMLEAFREMGIRDPNG